MTKFNSWDNALKEARLNYSSNLASFIYIKLFNHFSAAKQHPSKLLNLIFSDKDK